MRIRSQLLLALFLAAFVPIAVIAISANIFASNSLYSDEVDKLRFDNQQAVLQFQTFLDKYTDTAKGLTGLPPISGILGARNAKNGLFDSSSEEQWLSRLEQIFASIIKSDSQIDQLRFLDSSGKEIVRVNRVGDEVLVVKKSDLQSKSNRKYFLEGSKQAEGETYVSELNLNVENGEIELPHKPMLRFASPSFFNGKISGLIVLNIRAKDLLENILGDKNLILVDIEGNYIYSNNEGKRFTKQLDSEQNFFIENKIQDFKELSNPETSGLEMHIGERRAFLSNIVGGTNNQIFRIVNSRSERDLRGVIREFQKLILLVSIASLFIAILIGGYLSRKIARPVQLLREKMNNYSKNDGKTVVLDRGRGVASELKDLSQEFEKLTKEVLGTENTLREKVQKQTAIIAGSLAEEKEQNQELEKNKTAMLNLLEDVKEEKTKTANLALDLKKFQLAVENVEDAIIITDPEGSVLYVNKSIERITGFSREEIIGEKVGTSKSWGGKMDKPFYEDLWKTIKEDKKAFSAEITNKKKNGKEYIAFTTIAPILNRDKEVDFFVAVHRDITHRKEVDKMKTDFVSLASHQLRTPLTSMRLFLEMLLSGEVGKLDKKQKEYIENVDYSTARMIQLVNDLLNVARLETGRLSIDTIPVDLKLLMEEIIDDAKPLMDIRDGSIVLSVSEKSLKKIPADKALLRQALHNLITNAIKYSAGSKPKVSVKIEKIGEDLQIAVKDSGIGIPRSAQEKIFLKFYRADNASKIEAEGSGLGLYIAQMIMVASGGKLWFESEEGKGSTFFASLPIKGMKARSGEKGLAK